MKIKLFFPVLFLFVWNACTPPVTFNQPQPVGVDSLTVFPKRLIGRYISKDGMVLTVEPSRIVLHFDYEVKQPKDSLEWDSLTVEEKSRYRLDGDSVIEHVVDTDTLFCFSQDNVLKKFKGQYFLNTRNDSASWVVRKMKLQKGQLIIGSISAKEELKTLERISERPLDTIPQKISFTKKQFHEYVDSEGFSERDTFLKIK